MITSEFGFTGQLTGNPLALQNGGAQLALHSGAQLALPSGLAPAIALDLHSNNGGQIASQNGALLALRAQPVLRRSKGLAGAPNDLDRSSRRKKLG